MLDLLGKRGIYSLMVEGGPTVLKAFMTAQLAQAALITIVPRWLGQGSLQLVPDAGATLHNTIIKQAGDDMMMWGVFGA
jgi:riboflavin biosynthesis pyrimidine reductase